MILTTTNTIETGTIVSYKGLVSSNLILGNNAISEFISSFSDVFGGFSGELRSKMVELYKAATEEIIDKAKALGANGIVGLKVDFDELAGKGKSMFMVTMVGTAVKVEAEIEMPSQTSIEVISSELLKFEIEKRRLEQSVSENPYNLEEREWRFILSHNIPSLSTGLTKFFLQADKFYDPERSHIKQNYQNYLSTLEEDYAKKVVYEQIIEQENDVGKQFVSIIKKNHYFDPTYIVSVLKVGKLHIAIALLESEKDYYSRDDLSEMNALYKMLSDLPNTGEYKEVKGGVFSKGGKKYICEHEHVNDEKEEFCKECGVNIKGLCRDELTLVDLLKKRIDVLKDLFEAK